MTIYAKLITLLIIKYRGVRDYVKCIYVNVRKVAKLKNPYNQVPHLTQDTKWESDKIAIRHHKQEHRGQPFPSW